MVTVKVHLITSSGRYSLRKITEGINTGQKFQKIDHVIFIGSIFQSSERKQAKIF
jgi:hypothetical protein